MVVMHVLFNTRVKEQQLDRLRKFAWTNLHLTSLELKTFGERTQRKHLEDCIIYAINYGPNGLKSNDFSDMEVYEDHNTEKVMNVKYVHTTTLLKTSVRYDNGSWRAVISEE